MEHVLMFFNVLTLLLFVAASGVGWSIVVAYSNMTPFEKTFGYNPWPLIWCLCVMLVCISWWVAKFFI
jgi:hypothetical protein